MCIFSKTLVAKPEPETANQQPFNFKIWWQEEQHRNYHAQQVKRTAKVVHKCRLILFLSYGIVPPKFSIKRAFAYSGASVGLGTVTGVGVPVAGTAAGFTTSGRAAGSIAAGVQSSIGSVAAGSTFATLQSIGATGGFSILGPISVIAGAVGLTTAGVALTGVGIHKHIKEIDKFVENTVLILPHV